MQWCVGAMADWRGAFPEPDQAPVHGRVARAWERAAAAEGRGARDPDGGLAFHWAAHSWRRCAAACELAATPDDRLTTTGHGADVADAWEAVAHAWEAAAAAWLAVAAAQRHLDASRAAEDERARPNGTFDDSNSVGDEVSVRAAAVTAARRVADERVREAELCERNAAA